MPHFTNRIIEKTLVLFFHVFLAAIFILTLVPAASHAATGTPCSPPGASGGVCGNGICVSNSADGKTGICTGKQCWENPTTMCSASADETCQRYSGSSYCMNTAVLTAMAQNDANARVAADSGSTATINGNSYKTCNANANGGNGDCKYPGSEQCGNIGSNPQAVCIDIGSCDTNDGACDPKYASQTSAASGGTCTNDGTKKCTPPATCKIQPGYSLGTCQAVDTPAGSQDPSTSGADNNDLSGSTGSGTNSLKNPLGNVNSLEDLLGVVLDAVITLGTILLVLALVWVGALFVFAQGQEEKIRDARNSLMWTVIGGLVLLGAKAIQTVIQMTVTGLQ